MFTHGSPVAFCAVEMEARHGVVASKWSSASTSEFSSTRQWPGRARAWPGFAVGCLRC